MNGAGGALGPGPIRPSQAHEAQELSNGQDQHANGRAAPTGDRVEISAAARALAAAGVAPSGDVASTDGSSGLNPERLQDVLTRLQGGFYDSPQVREATAQNLLPDLRTLATS